MLAIYIVTLLVLIGSDILPSKVHAGASESSDSGSSSKSGNSKDSVEQHCRKAAPKQEAIENKVKDLNKKKQPLPTCTSGSSGTISKIDIFNANSGKTTTLLTCSGCTGPDVPVTSSKECKNVPDVFRPDLKEFCQIVHPRCKNITVYRCGSPAPPLSTTIVTETTRPVTSTPLQTTTSVPPPSVTTQGNASVSIIPGGVTPSLVPGYKGYDY